MGDERFARAHALLQQVLDPGRDGEDPDRPETVQAMPIVLNMPKQDPPERIALLEAAARAVVAVCLDPRAGENSAFAESLANWYGARIRKIARRARNSQWERVQILPGVTMNHGGAQARAFLPCAVQDTDPLLDKLQIGGTDLPATPPVAQRPGIPVIVVDGTLGMSVGKAAAQVGHGSMLLAATMTLEQATAWSETGYDLQVMELKAAEFAGVCARPGVVPVQDAGYTEVAPGSVTVVADPAGFLGKLR